MLIDTLIEKYGCLIKFKILNFTNYQINTNENKVTRLLFSFISHYPINLLSGVSSCFAHR